MLTFFADIFCWCFLLIGLTNQKASYWRWTEKTNRKCSKLLISNPWYHMVTWSDSLLFQILFARNFTPDGIMRELRNFLMIRLLLGYNEMFVTESQIFELGRCVFTDRSKPPRSLKNVTIWENHWTFRIWNKSKWILVALNLIEHRFWTDIHFDGHVIIHVMWPLATNHHVIIRGTLQNVYSNIFSFIHA